MLTTLTNLAKHENFDLIVVGSRELDSTASIVLGSISRQMVAKADCNVLVVKKIGNSSVQRAPYKCIRGSHVLVSTMGK